MTIAISNEKTVGDLQQIFSSAYPFLRIVFYKLVKTDPALPVKKYLAPGTSLKSAGLINPGLLEISDAMSVNELENTLLNKFGLDGQVSRKSGMLWLETTMTNKWSLSKQNEHGREISLTSFDIPPYRSDSEAI